MTSDKSDQDDWEWLIASLKKYKHLHMYELSQPTQVLEWARQNDVFVADSNTVNNRYEVLLLSLPPKLISSNASANKLSKDRDFKMVSGGSHSQPVHAMATVSEQHFVTLNTSEVGATLLWEIQEDKDVIVPKDALKGQMSHCSPGQNNVPVNLIAANPHVRFEVTCGSCLNDLQAIDLETGRPCWSNKSHGELSHPIGSIDYMDRFSVVVCDAFNGQLCVFDTRHSSYQTSGAYASQPQNPVDSSRETLMKLAQESPNSNKETTCFSWSCAINIQSRHYRTKSTAEFSEGNMLAAVLSTRGDVSVYDLRDISKILCTATVAKKATAFPPCIRWSPRQKDLLSVSGWDNCVRIYDIKTFTHDPSQSAPSEPIFIHDGHTNSRGGALRVTNHLWHEDEPNLILSADSDGSLHAWDWLPA